MTVAAWPYPAPADDGAARHLHAGVGLPRLELAATDGRVVDVGGLPGLSVLIVYPWTGRAGVDNPPGWDDIAGAHGSTPQLEGFRDSFEKFSALGATLFGLSGQATGYQAELVSRLALPFPILSDEAGRARAALRLPAFKAGGSLFLSRLVLIANAGAITDAIYPVHPPPDCAQQTLERLGLLA